MNKARADGRKRYPFLSAVVVICSVIVSIGIFNRVSNRDHFRVLDALHSFNPSGDCELQIDSQRSLRFLGGAPLYKITLVENGERYSSHAGVYFAPTRITNNGSNFYHYEWNEPDENTDVRWSYFNLKMGWNGTVEWLEVGRCESPIDKEYLGYAHKVCSDGVSAIRCT